MVGKTGSPHLSDTKPSDSDGYCVLLRLCVAIETVLNYASPWVAVERLFHYVIVVAYCTGPGGRRILMLPQFAISFSEILKQLLRLIQITFAWRAPPPAASCSGEGG